MYLHHKDQVSDISHPHVVYLNFYCFQAIENKTERIPLGLTSTLESCVVLVRGNERSFGCFPDYSECLRMSFGVMANYAHEIILIRCAHIILLLN